MTIIHSLSVMICLIGFLGACGNSSDNDETPVVNNNDDQTFYLSNRSAFAVEAQWSDSLFSGRTQANNNFVELSFYLPGGEAASELVFDSNGFNAMISSIDHDSSDKTHKVIFLDGEPHRIRVEDVYFDVASQDQQGWSIQLTAVVNGVEDSVLLPVPEVLQGAQDPLVPDNALLSNNETFYLSFYQASVLRTNLGQEDNVIEFLLFDRDGLALTDFTISKLEPWMYMESGHGHGNFNNDHTWRTLSGSGHHVIVENIFFPMPSQVEISGELTVLGYWVLNVSVEIAGEPDQVELVLPKVIE